MSMTTKFSSVSWGTRTFHRGAPDSSDGWKGHNATESRTQPPSRIRQDACYAGLKQAAVLLQAASMAGQTVWMSVVVDPYRAFSARPTMPEAAVRHRQKTRPDGPSGRLQGMNLCYEFGNCSDTTPVSNAAYRRTTCRRLHLCHRMRQRVAFTCDYALIRIAHRVGGPHLETGGARPVPE